MYEENRITYNSASLLKLYAVSMAMPSYPSGRIYHCGRQKLLVLVIHIAKCDFDKKMYKM